MCLKSSLRSFIHVDGAFILYCLQTTFVTWPSSIRYFCLYLNKFHLLFVRRTSSFCVPEPWFTYFLVYCPHLLERVNKNLQSFKMMRSLYALVSV
jgi:hypothetical protein